ncbi:RidA family protein [Micromonospora sp. WMMD558]|uniref:RidA family protein n=1 Tax=unclassified Micromonospora TaxID=2617518 RepID=UPI0012B48C62|nr:RidA family protein [Micromonospora sp. WMMC415]QGN49183.1 RidA family protein [Micromonospora sp. WMMC415]
MADPAGRGALAAPPAPQGHYVPAVVHAGTAYAAGMTPRVDGRLVARGLVGVDLTVAEARAAAGLAAGNALAAVAQAVGGLEQVRRCLRMTVYVACRPGFTQHTAVADGASEVLRDWLGDRGAVARSAVGVASLPSDAPVEVELTVAVTAR